MKLYDERLFGDPKDEDNVPPAYVFNYRDDGGPQSELLSVDFNFNLPEATAASLLVGNNKSADSVVGAEDPTSERMATLAHDPSIQNIAIRYDDTQSTPENAEDAEDRVQVNSINVNIRNYLNEYDSILSVNMRESEENANDDDENFQEIERYYKGVSGYIEFLPSIQFAEAAKSDALFSTLPSAASVTLKLLGISGFRYGDRFKVKDLLPTGFDAGEYFLTGFKHEITPDGWFTSMEGQFVGRRRETTEQ